MRFKHLVWLVLASLGSSYPSSPSGLHQASLNGLLLMPPSFAGDGVSLHPALHPDHNPNDLLHLHPQFSKELYYSQEGHRPAIHGAKHAQVKATFNQPTVVLDHSSHIKSVTCEKDDTMMTICFKSPKALRIAEKTWQHTKKGTFNLVTYHPGCGDRTGTRRSFFEASMPLVDSTSSCIIAPITRRQEADSLREGDVSWRTYTSPYERRRQDVEGHVRLSPASPAPSSNATRGNITYAGTVDLTTTAWAVKQFYGTTEINTDVPDHPVEDGPEFISTNGTVYKRDDGDPKLESWLRQGAEWVAKQVFKVWDRGEYNPVVKVLRFVEDHALYSLGSFVEERKRSSLHGFNPSYHRDFNITNFPRQNPDNKPAKILGVDHGVALTKPFVWGGIQCAQCGVVGEFTIDGAFSFSLTKGITKGEISFINKGPLDIYGIFGFSIHGQVPKEFTKFKKQLMAVPLSPIAIPGIFTLGPQVTVSAAATIELAARAEFLLGGILRLSRGEAKVKLVGSEKSRLDGLQPSFTPVVKAGNVKHVESITLDLGVPNALEGGLDVFNGMFKKTVAIAWTPSVFMTGKVSNKDSDSCKGYSLSLGIKNRIYVGAFDLIEATLKEWQADIAELFCIKSDGVFQETTKEESTKVHQAVAKQFNGAENLVPEEKPKLEDISLELDSGSNDAGYHVLMDADETSVLISGDDGYLYFVDKNKYYDLSAPWGTIDTTTNIITFDVFGRLLNYDNQEFSENGLHRVAPVRVTPPTKMPVTRQGGGHYKHLQLDRFSVAIVPLRPRGKKQHRDSYGIARVMEKKVNGNRYSTLTYVHYPTACEVAGQGVRLFMTTLPVRRDGVVEGIGKMRNGEKYWKTAFKELGGDQGLVNANAS